MCGTAFFPKRLPDTWLVKRSTRITGFFDDMSGATNNVFLYLHGRLLYDDEPGATSPRMIPIPYVERPLDVYGQIPRR
jgi:hypothetical protein